MPDNAELDRLYVEAKSALKKREYDRATGLLTQILVIDENYKDVSRLLAQTVKLKRRRWYNHPALWGALGLVVVIGLGIWLSKVLLRPIVTTTLPVESTVTPSITTIPPIATVTLTPTATPIPLTWKRISIGQEFPRDTVSDIVSDPKDRDVLYAGMSDAGIYKSIDGGVSWAPAFHGINNPQIWSLHIDAQDPQTFYATLNSDYTYKTSDGGNNWRKLGDVGEILMDPLDSSHLFAWMNGNYSGIERSRPFAHFGQTNGIFLESFDKGETWTKNYQAGESDCPNSFGDSAVIRGQAMNKTTLFIAASGSGDACKPGLYQSDDNGHTWTFTGLDDPNISLLAVGKDKRGNDILYAEISEYLYPPNISGGQPSYEFGHALVLSFDDAQTWQQVSRGTSCDSITIDAEIPGTVYCNKIGQILKISEDGGRNWQLIGHESNDRLRSWTFGSITKIHISHVSEGTRIRLGTTEGLYTTSDEGQSWQPQNNGLGATKLQLRLDPADNSIMYVAAQSIRDLGCSLYRSSDLNRNWKLILTSSSGTSNTIAMPAQCEVEFDAENNLYVVQDGSLVRSSDKGNTWNGLPLPKGPRSFAWISPNPYKPGHLYGGDTSKMFYSTDSGLSWQPNDKITFGQYGTDFTKILFDPQGKKQYAFDGHSASRSEDGGKTWLSCAPMDELGFITFGSSLAIDPRDGNHIFVPTKSGLQGGLFTSKDGCQSWQRVEGLDSKFINGVALDPNNPDTIYAGTDGGAYISYDAGEMWGQVNDGLLGATVVYSIAVDKESNVYAATPYGVFKLEKK